MNNHSKKENDLIFEAYREASSEFDEIMNTLTDAYSKKFDEALKHLVQTLEKYRELFERRRDFVSAYWRGHKEPYHDHTFIYNPPLKVENMFNRAYIEMWHEVKPLLMELEELYSKLNEGDSRLQKYSELIRKISLHLSHHRNDIEADLKDHQLRWEWKQSVRTYKPPGIGYPYFGDTVYNFFLDDILNKYGNKKP